MARRILIALLAVMALHATALDVVNTAGSLSSMITDKNISELRVSGTMNAADFYFITDNLHHLSSIDLGDVTVLACQLGSMRYFTTDFAADELPVVALGGLGLTHVVLPQGLKSIGKGALAGCDLLTSITLPPALEQVGDYAFTGCTALTQVVLPASVTTVGNGAFMRCTALKSLTVEPSSNLAQVGDMALMDCPALETLNLGTALQSMGERVLAGSGLRELNLAENRSLTSIGDWAMVQTPVEVAVMPTGLTTLGDGAFLYDSQLTSIDLGNKLSTMSDYLLAGTGLVGELTVPVAKRIGDYVFYNVSSLSSVTLPATLIWLGDSAMAGMTGMTTLTSRAVEVPDLGQNVWAGVDQPSVLLTVPASSTRSYKDADQWRDFMFKNVGVLGDVNADGEVNLADINALIDIILTGRGNEDTMARADVNADGEINVADINFLINLIMKGDGASTLRSSKKSKKHG